MLWMRRISARISRRSLASRLDSGSSISTSGGSTTMARAIATRCCWPPDSWPGSLSACVVQPHQRQRLVHPPRDLRLRPALRRQAEADVAPHRHVREQRVVLEHHAEAAILRPDLVDAAARPARSLPSVSCSSPAMQFSAVDLPQPDGPSRATNSPRLTVRVTSRSACVWPKSRLTPVEPQLAEVARDDRHAALLADPRADLLVPALERIDQLVRGQRHLRRHVGDQLRIERAGVFA